MSYATVKSYSSTINSSTLERTTPVPNWVLDQALSGLTDSQAKLLLIIARQTNGWSDKVGNRKSSDWMSNRFIQEKTGCSKASVSRAIAVLIDKGLIEVRDSEGQLLLTSAERRRCKQMYFALKNNPPQQTYGAKSITRETLQSAGEQNTLTNESQEPLLEVQHLEELEKHPQNEDVGNGESEMSVTNEDVVNPKFLKNVPKTSSNCGTTKETLTKENLNNNFVDPQNDTLPNEDVHDEAQNEEVSDLPHFEELGNEASKATQPKLSYEAKQVLAAYRQQFREHFPNQAIPKATQSDFEKLESYFEKHTPQVLIKLLPTFFTVDYDFNSRNEHSLHAFVHSVNILLYGMKRVSHFARIKNSER